MYAGWVLLAVSALAMIGMGVHAAMIGGLSNDYRAALVWIRVGFWSNVLALGLLLLGRGTARALALMGALVLGFFWVGITLAR